MPGTQGGGPGSFEIKAQLPDVANIQPNSRVRVGDANVGTVTKIERRGLARAGHHADSTVMSTCRPTRPPRSARPACWARCTSSWRHPIGVAPEGKLHNGSLIPLTQRGRLPHHRADACRAVAAAQRRRHRPDPGHHQGVRHRVRRARARPAQPRSASSTSSSAISTTRPATSSRPPTASTTSSASSPLRSRCSTRRSAPSPMR